MKYVIVFMLLFCCGCDKQSEAVKAFCEECDGNISGELKVNWLMSEFTLKCDKFRGEK